MNLRPIPPEADYLPDGRRAYWQTSDFGCFNAAIATVIQVDPSELPTARDHDGHSRADELDSLAAVHRWLLEHGWRIRYRDFAARGWRDYLPDGTAVQRPIEGCWIGVNVHPEPGFDHNVVCLDDTLVFNPALRLPCPAGAKHERITNVHYGITLERTNDARDDS